MHWLGFFFTNNVSSITFWSWLMLTIAQVALNTIVFSSPYWIGTTSLPDFPLAHALSDQYDQEWNVAQANVQPASVHIALFGLYQHCFQTTEQLLAEQADKLHIDNTTQQQMIITFKCTGDWTQPATIVDKYLRVSTALVGLACLLGFACMLVGLLSIIALTNTLLLIASFAQIIIGIYNDIVRSFFFISNYFK